jgi:hypothetical protein
LLPYTYTPNVCLNKTEQLETQDFLKQLLSISFFFSILWRRFFNRKIVNLCFSHFFKSSDKAYLKVLFGHSFLNTQFLKSIKHLCNLKFVPPETRLVARTTKDLKEIGVVGSIPLLAQLTVTDNMSFNLIC